MKYKIKRTFAEKGKVKVKKYNVTKEGKLKDSFIKRVGVGSKKVAVAVTKSQAKKFNTYSQKKALARKILRQGPRPTLDLRRRPEREIPVKQHGFKEGEITRTSILNQ